MQQSRHHVLKAYYPDIYTVARWQKQWRWRHVHTVRTTKGVIYIFSRQIYGILWTLSSQQRQNLPSTYCLCPSTQLLKLNDQNCTWLWLLHIYIDCSDINVIFDCVSYYHYNNAWKRSSIGIVSISLRQKKMQMEIFTFNYYIQLSIALFNLHPMHKVLHFWWSRLCI